MQVSASGWEIELSLLRKSIDELLEWRAGSLDALRHDICEVAIDADFLHQQPVDEPLMGADIGGDTLRM